MVSALAALALSLAVTAAAPGASTADPVLEQCVISVINDVKVPGAEAGVLIELEAKEGMQVKADQVLGRIDDREARAQAQIKRLERDIAKKKADTDVEVRAAEAAKGVSYFTWKRSQLANDKVNSAVAEVDIQKLKLQYDQSVLAKEKAQIEQAEAGLTAQAKEAEVEATKVGVVKREIRAPFDGVVRRVYRQIGEWVPLGEPVLQIIRVDRLRVKGDMDAKEYDPEEVIGHAVTVEAELAHGRKVRAPGKVVFVDPTQQSDRCEVVAEIENPRAGENTLLRSGMRATMTIHLSKTPQANVKAAVFRRE